MKKKTFAIWRLKIGFTAHQAITSSFVAIIIVVTVSTFVRTIDAIESIFTLYWQKIHQAIWQFILYVSSYSDKKCINVSLVVYVLYWWVLIEKTVQKDTLYATFFVILFLSKVSYVTFA